MTTRKCDVCASVMTSRRTNAEAPYAYVVGGLPRVGLAGIDVYRCPKCDVDAPVIPKIGQLHDVLARLFLRKAGPLAGDELRFLRKHAKLPAQRFAALLGIDPSHLSRVENGKIESLGSTTDRLARAIASVVIASPMVRDVLLGDAETTASLRRPLVRLHNNRWKESVA